MAVKELNIKHTRIPADFLPISVRNNIEQCFVEFVTENGDSFDISCHGDRILIRAHSHGENEHPRLVIEDLDALNFDLMKQIVLSVK